jgi:hypothetical protein
MRLRRKTREAHARGIQQVRFEACQPTVAQQRADIEANKAKAKRLADQAKASAAREKLCECKPGRRPLPECHVHGNR